MAVQAATTNRSTTYQRDGYLTGFQVLAPNQLDESREAFDRLEAEVGKEVSSIGVFGKHKEIEWVWELAAHPNVLNLARSALGPDLLLLGTHFFCKYPEADRGAHFVAWHQDVTYWSLEPLEPGRVATVWLALDDADVDNGCMRVIPGSHHNGLLPHGKSSQAGNLLSENQAIDPEALDETIAVDIELPAGSASIHDGLLVHGSNPNCSQRRRCGLTIRFATPTVRPVLSEPNPTKWTPILVAGDDRYHHFELYPRPAFR